MCAQCSLMRTTLSMLLFTIAIAAIAAPLESGRGSAQAAPQQPSNLTFEVATIKPSEPGLKFGMIKPLPGGDGYTAQNLSVKNMISVVYRVPWRQIIGGPDWLSSEHFDVEAKTDRAYSVEDLHEMFRNLLAERFNLKLHQDLKEGPVYELTIAKTGLKMKPDGEGEDPKIPILPGPNGSVGTRVSMKYLCFWLGQNLQNDNRPVIDKTGLTQSYDFTLAFAPQLPPGAPEGNLPPELLNRPSIFQAVKEQLGLQLTPAKGPVEYYVIDHVEKPSPN
jgi:uncharacterized protein (TIGR03435 family)